MCFGLTWLSSFVFCSKSSRLVGKVSDEGIKWYEFSVYTCNVQQAQASSGCRIVIVFPTHPESLCGLM